MITAKLIVGETSGDAYLVPFPCPMCGKEHDIHAITHEQAEMLRKDRWLVQEIFPELTPAQREVFITGTCPGCWDKLFGDENDEDGDEVFESEESKYDEQFATEGFD